MDHRATGGGPEGALAPEASGSRVQRDRRRVCILVLGMHRSGTSALARAITLLGAAPPAGVVPSDEHNAAGYWEPRSLMRLDDELIRDAGSHWDDWRTFDPNVLGEERLDGYRREIAHLIRREFGTAPLLVLKEPRISRMVPFYSGLLENDLGLEVRYLLTSRNPLSVAASLRNRNGLTPQYSALVWLRHQLDAERATRGRRRVLVSYEALMTDLRATTRHMAEGLGLPWSDAMLEPHFQTRHQHHAADETALKANPDIADWVKDAYSMLRRLEERPQDDEAIATLDAIKDAFDRASSVFGPAFYSEFEVRRKPAAIMMAMMRHLFGQSGRRLVRTSADVAVLYRLLPFLHFR